MFTANDARMITRLSKMDGDAKVKVMTMVKIYEEKIKSAAEHGERILAIDKDEFERDFGKDEDLINHFILSMADRGFISTQPSILGTYSFMW